MIVENLGLDKVVMTYPRVLLTRPLRRALMIGLMALFGLLAPTVILYSAGYRYDPNTGGIKVTGVISIAAEPADTQVTINNVRINKRPPFELTNRAPGRYQLRLEKTGFKPWEKEIVVESKQTTYIKNISLLREQLPVPVEWTLPTTSTSSLQFSGSPDGRYALTRVSESGIETITLFATERTPAAVISRRATTEPSLLSWSPGGSALFLAVRNNLGWRLTLIALADPSRTASYRQEQASTPRWQWSQTNDTVMFAPDGHKVIGLNLDGPTTVATITTIWFVTGERVVWTPAANHPPLPETINLTTIVDINQKRIIGQTANDLAIIKRADNPPRIQTLPTPNVRYNPATKEWLAWSAFELWTIYENGEVKLLNRASDRIRAVEPLDENGVLLVVSDRGLNAFNPGYSVAHDLFLGQVESASVNQKQRLIYFLGEVGGRRGVFQLEY